MKPLKRKIYNLTIDDNALDYYIATVNRNKFKTKFNKFPSLRLKGILDEETHYIIRKARKLRK